MYNNGLDACAEIINGIWLSKPRRRYLEMRKKLHRLDFKEEYGDFVTLLN